MKFILLGLLCIVCGVFSFMGAEKQWDFFVNDRKYRSMSSILGDSGARIFYMFLGIFLVIIGVVMTISGFGQAF